MKDNLIKIKCQSNLQSYDIVIQKNSFSQVVKDLSQFRKIVIICDSNVRKYYGESLLQAITAEKKICDLISFPAGESNKNLNTFLYLHEQIALRLDRNSCIITLGGGVTGDMGGFVASTYMRGISFIHIPTSLLAMVDSSVGGKLGVNTSIGKNVVGVFNNPKKVIIDPSLLNTLPTKFIIDGMAEVIKHAFLSGEEFVSFLETNTEGIFDLNLTLLTQIISHSLHFKVKIVEQDERDLEIRNILNYGHTIGHALEETLGYQNISHGNAVAIGMNAVNYLSLKEGFLSTMTFDRMQQLIRQYKLPTFLSDLGLQGDPEKILQFLNNDKKNQDDQIVMVLLQEIGKPIISRTQTIIQMKEAINYILKSN
ncbi:3-dehydroquinate synthase [Promethearchaeum syntrophicum]|uniref:3-dehydroquinate synthase n=1 Tax=Promethearchaeum syntrophicum TaxID=2594042 RepID=A0A5B9DCG6_9ARCH|nr:3-dehydroquinate synthase [Candidatus Prometheoarchaeum syntrophicum]QEE16396.1 3-dehydroquinate synthase [Candidatus Prometheoarchaeum syntrophicum]